MQTMRRIAIIGTGLLGASLGLALRRNGFVGVRVGIGRRLSTVEKARQLGAVDEVHTTIATGVEGADLVVLATPIGAFEPVLTQVAAAVSGRTVITDVGSTKQHVCDLACRLLAHPARFVGSHPMAGSEQQGPEHARADLYDAALCVLTPQGTNAAADAVAMVENLWRSVGMKLVHKSPAEHDQLVAAISHLPHVAAALLVQVADAQQAISLASTGFRDTTRVASGDPDLWHDILMTNRPAMLHALDALDGRMAELRQAIAAGDGEAIHRFLAEQKAHRDRWLRGRGESGPPAEEGDHP